jgi:hypothetical protein
MTKDLAFLPLWYAEKGDFVFVEGQDFPPFPHWLPAGLSPCALPLTRQMMASGTASLPRLEAAPWGVSRQSLHLFAELKQSYGLDIDIPAWKDGHPCLTGRQTAARCLAEVRRLLPDMSFPEAPVFFSHSDDVERYLHRHGGPFVLKAPYSSSGRGLIWLEENSLCESDRNRIKGILRKQGAISLEPRLNRVADFALQFCSDGKGSLSCKGLSVFATNRRGVYQGNRLQSPSALWALLLEYVGEAELLRVSEAVSQALRRIYAHAYAGYLGVDMLIYQAADGAYGIHPCVEVNLRYTMGMIAVRLAGNCLAPGVSALFNILYESAPRRAYEQHRLMEQSCPPEIREGKLQKGYLSLCPVGEDTHYTACILAE